MKSYRYIDGIFEVRTEIKHSVFIATVAGELDDRGAEDFVRSIRRKYPDATHNCYAYIADSLGNVTRSSDDGEPSGTAGLPILDVLKKQDLKRSAIVVTRYFGGVKLGASGLVGAYSSIAAEGVKAAVIAEKFECRQVRVAVDYSLASAVTRKFRECGAIDSEEYDEGVRITGYIPVDEIPNFFDAIRGVTLGKALIDISEDARYIKL